MKFKGWTIPGPEVPGGEAPILGSLPSLETLDALCGHFRLYQLKDGHRFSTDDVLTAWYGVLSSPSVARVLDLGSGLGTVALFTAWKLRGARFVTVEAQEESLRLARKSVAYNGCTERFDLRLGDFRDPGALRSDETFDLITGSPPYFPLGSGVLGDHPQKVACRFEIRGTVYDYAATAARHLAPGGVFACVFPVQPEPQEERALQAARESGLTVVRRRDVVLREGDAPLLGLFAMMKAADLPETLKAFPYREPDLVIRSADGRVTSEYLSIKLSMGLPPTG